MSGYLCNDSLLLFYKRVKCSIKHQDVVKLGDLFKNPTMTILILLVKPDEELGRASCWGGWLEEENCINKSVVKERIHEIMSFVLARQAF